jgi:hypothetical protein
MYAIRPFPPGEVACDEPARAPAMTVAASRDRPSVDRLIIVALFVSNVTSIG